MTLPSFLDRYLARHAYEAQDREAVVAPNRQDNLEEPIYPLHRVRGSFDRQARNTVLMVSGTALRAGAAALGVGLIIIAATLAAV